MFSNLSMAATNFTYHQVQHLKFSTVIISRPCVLTTNSHCSLPAVLAALPRQMSSHNRQVFYDVLCCYSVRFCYLVAAFELWSW